MEARVHVICSMRESLSRGKKDDSGCNRTSNMINYWSYVVDRHVFHSTHSLPVVEKFGFLSKSSLTSNATLQSVFVFVVNNGEF